MYFALRTRCPEGSHRIVHFREPGSMMIALQNHATTTPAVRAQIQQSSTRDHELAERYSISRTTV
jgi:hypothetical protein